MKQLLLNTAKTAVKIATGLLVFGSISNAQPQFKTSHQYQCLSVIGTHSILFTVNLGNIDNKVKVQNDIADFDPAYAPKKGDKLRFIYEENDEGISAVIMQSKLQDGIPSGYLAIETRADDYARTSYSCRLLH